MRPTPLLACDIDPKGTATPASGAAKPDIWRWEHFDLADPHLAEWLKMEVDPLVARALLAPETRPRVDAHEDGLIVTLRGVNLNAGADPEDMVSLRLWVTKTRVISVRRRRLMALDALRQNAEAGTAPASPAAFLAALTEGLAQRIETVSLQFEEAVDEIEESSITATAAQSGEFLALRQSIIKLRRFVGPQRDALEHLATGETGIISDIYARHISETANRTARTVEALDSSRERLIAIQDHLDAQTAMKLGRNSYVLSVMAAIFLPLGFLTGLFGVNVAGMPGTEVASAFWLVTGLCALIGIGLFAYFRWNDWL